MSASKLAVRAAMQDYCQRQMEREERRRQYAVNARTALPVHSPLLRDGPIFGAKARADEMPGRAIKALGT